MAKTKTDNANPKAKLDLRRYFLRKYHADDPPNVLDCCQGSGLLWSTLRKEFTLAGYWGVDQKPKKGRVKIDSQRILAQPGWPQNVVDIDTYGRPWKHWLAMLPNVARPITVFLTIGGVGGVGMAPGQSIDKSAAQALRLGRLPVPNGFGSRLNNLSVSYVLTRCCDYNILLSEAVEAVSSGNARYIGVRLEKANGGSARNTTAALNTTTVGGNGHVLGCIVSPGKDDVSVPR